MSYLLEKNFKYKATLRAKENGGCNPNPTAARKQTDVTKRVSDQISLEIKSITKYYQVLPSNTKYYQEYYQDLKGGALCDKWAHSSRGYNDSKWGHNTPNNSLHTHEAAAEEPQ